MKQGKLTVTEKDGRVDWKDVAITIDDQSLTLEELATAWRMAHSELATAKQRVKVLERATSMSQQGLAEVHLRNEARLAKRINELETQLAESRERERKIIENILSIRYWESCDGVLQVKDLQWFKEIESPQASAEPLFYVQNRGYCGDSLLFWKKDGKGYTVDVNEAWKVTRERGESICRSRPEQDWLWPVETIEKASQLHCNSELLRDENGNRLKPIQVASQASAEEPRPTQR